MSKMYTLDGTVQDFTPTDCTANIFRKYVDITHQYGRNELHFAQLIHDANDPRLLRIFRVAPCFYDSEILDLKYCGTETFLTDVRECIRALHTLHIVYVDFSRNNIGYSHIDKRWKLFDFDCSGKVNCKNTMMWLIEPPQYKNYKLALQLKDVNDSLFDIDDTLLDAVKFVG